MNSNDQIKYYNPTFSGSGSKYAFVLFLFLASCITSETSNFYSLSPVEPDQGASTLKNISVRVGPIVIPDSINKAQIVTRVGKNRVKMSEFHRWAGSLQDEIQKTISENISTLLPTEKVYFDQEIEYTPADFQVVVNLREFSGELGKKVTLNANWTIIDTRNEKKITTKKSVLSKNLSGPTYEEFVQAQSSLLTELSREIVSEFGL